MQNKLSQEYDTLASQLTRLHGEACQVKVWWLRHVIIRLESCRQLAAATQAVVARRSHRPQATARDELRHYLESMQLLRASPIATEESLLTIFMLILYEQHTLGSIPAFACHTAAMVALLHASPNKWIKSEIARFIIYSAQWTTLGLAIRQGRRSLFEKAIWLEMDAPSVGAPDAQRLEKAAHQNWIKLPRLIAHLQQVKKRGFDATENVRKGLSLAEKILLRNSEESIAESSVLDRGGTEPTDDERNRPWIPYSYSFDDLYDYIAVTKYCRSRLALLNAYHELLRASQSTSPIVPFMGLEHQFKVEQHQRVTENFMSWQQSEQFRGFLGSRGLTDCVYIWGYLMQQDWRYLGQPPEDTRQWMMMQARKGLPWDSFDPFIEMDDTAALFLGGPWLEHLVLCRTIPDIPDITPPNKDGATKLQLEESTV